MLYFKLEHGYFYLGLYMPKRWLNGFFLISADAQDATASDPGCAFNIYINL